MKSGCLEAVAQKLVTVNSTILDAQFCSSPVSSLAVVSGCKKLNGKCNKNEGKSLPDLVVSLEPVPVRKRSVLLSCSGGFLLDPERLNRALSQSHLPSQLM